MQGMMDLLQDGSHTPAVAGRKHERSHKQRADRYGRWIGYIRDIELWITTVYRNEIFRWESSL